jgi:mannose-6-phosphate isomerase-like protein (cupin superfamily)
MGGKQSLSFSVRNGVMKYHITHGEAWVLISGKGQIVKKGDDVIVEEGDLHKFLNNSKTEECKFVCEYAGPLDMRKFLDIENAVIEG